jgi:hypothetical protein
LPGSARRVAVLVLLAAACGHREPAPPHDECARVVQHVLDLELGTLSAMPDVLAKPVSAGMPAYRQALMQSCTNDRWSSASTACLAAAKSGDEAQACRSGFTPDQQTHLADAYAALLAPGKQASGSNCDEVSCTLDSSPPCCQKLKRAKP